MSDVYIMTTIIDRKNSKKYLDLYKKDKLEVMYITLGEGTARGDILDYLGLEASEKMVIFNFVQQHDWMLTKKNLQRKLQIDAPGEGIAFLVPLSSIGGKRTLQFLLDRQELPESEESTLKDTTYELIIAIADQGNLEMVMDAARGAGAYGGTVIHAKGTGMEYAEKYLGVTIAAEKAMIFIVTKKDQKNNIMKAIMEQAGMQSPAKTIVFSLPVTDTAGLRLVDLDEN
ncbi:MAG: P-II family nitrogen regulator [Lachnospiraceae bacterium]|nr:P-II family nitrogen regulator [Lachnospiraceae bacterium]